MKKKKIEIEKLLTILVPAYNVEKYIEEALKTIISSKFIDLIEILVVNDGSKDSTEKIVAGLQKSCKSIRLINKENGGHGSTINTGIKFAKGKYFRIMDGDDWLDTDNLDKYLAKLMNEEADLVLTDLVECFMKNNLKRPVSYYFNIQPFCLSKLKDIKFSEWGPMLPTSTIKTEVIRKLNFQIDEKCFYVDQEYNLLCYLCAESVVYYPYFIYQYRLEREGQSMERASLIRNVSSHEKVCIRLVSEYMNHYDTLSGVQRSYIENRMVIPMCNMQYMLAEEWCRSKDHFLSFDNSLKKYDAIYNNPKVSGSLTKFYRITNGLFIKHDSVIRKFAVLKNKLVSKFSR